ncbi:MAG: gliding motility-associated C-terminal domain-containing protein [Saprospiraceae bacterium]
MKKNKLILAITTIFFLFLKTAFSQCSAEIRCGCDCILYRDGCQIAEAEARGITFLNDLSSCESSNCQSTCSGGGSNNLNCNRAISISDPCSYSHNFGTHNEVNDVEEYCNGANIRYGGDEVIYKLTPMKTGDFTFDLQTTQSGRDLDMFLLNVCDANSCLFNTDGRSDKFTINLSANHTYYLVVDTDLGQGIGESNYTLSISGSCSPSSGQTCNPNDFTEEILNSIKCSDSKYKENPTLDCHFDRTIENWVIARFNYTANGEKFKDYYNCMGELVSTCRDDGRAECNNDLDIGGYFFCEGLENFDFICDDPFNFDWIEPLACNTYFPRITLDEFTTGVQVSLWSDGNDTYFSFSPGENGEDDFYDVNGNFITSCFLITTSQIPDCDPFWNVIFNLEVKEYKLFESCDGPQSELDCSTPIILNCGPEMSWNTTLDITSNVDRYCNGNNTGLTGPETVFSFTPPETGEYFFEMTGVSPNQDMDMFLLTSCDPNDCIGTSDGGVGLKVDEILVELNKDVTYFLIVDGDNGSNSNFNLSVTCKEKPSCTLSDIVMTEWINNLLLHRYCNDQIHILITFFDGTTLVLLQDIVGSDNGSFSFFTCSGEEVASCEITIAGTMCEPGSFVWTNFFDNIVEEQNINQSIIGSSCDDGDAETENDVITESCDCRGEMKQECKIEVNVSSTSTTCFSLTDGLAIATVSDNSASYDFIWSNGTKDESVMESFANSFAPGTQWVYVIDGECNSDTQFFQITAGPEYKIDLVASILVPPSCEGSSDGRVELEISPKLNISYTYDFPDLGIMNTTNPVLSDLSEGNFVVIITDRNGCIGEDIINLRSDIRIGDLCDDGDPNSNDDVIVIGCKCEGEIPDQFVETNIITPNGDGRDDMLRFTNGSVIPNSEIWIFNRLGDQVYHKKDYTNDWTADGVASGIYYYVLKIGELEIKKTLTILK